MKLLLVFEGDNLSVLSPYDRVVVSGFITHTYSQIVVSTQRLRWGGEGNVEKSRNIHTEILKDTLRVLDRLCQ